MRPISMIETETKTSNGVNQDNVNESTHPHVNGSHVQNGESFKTKIFGLH